MTDYRRFLPIHNDHRSYRTARRAIILRYGYHGRDWVRMVEADLYGFCLGWYNHTHYS